MLYIWIDIALGILGCVFLPLFWSLYGMPAGSLFGSLRGRWDDRTPKAEEPKALADGEAGDAGVTEAEEPEASSDSEAAGSGIREPEEEIAMPHEMRTDTPIGVLIGALVCLIAVCVCRAVAGGDPCGGALWVLVTVFMLAGAWIDFCRHVIPNRLLLISIAAWVVMVLISAASSGWNAAWLLVLRCVAGGAVWFVVFLFIAWLSRGSVGMGDVKLMGILGLYLGLYQSFGVILLGMFLCAIVGIVLLIRKSATKKSGLPFAPFLSAAVVVLSIISVFVQ